MTMIMEVSKDLSSELEIGSSMAAFQKALESQKQLFHNQIDQLRSIVVTQCKLTGVNPLSQEMAAGALSIKIGKRPRDLLNPKAVKYMQSVFSIKDAISKKESREISARFGVTVTQVREYFATQRSRVRKMVRLSREKAIIMSTRKEFQDVVSTDSDPMLPIDPIPLSSVSPPNVAEAPCSNQDDVLPALGEFEKQFVENIFSSMCKEETFSGQVKLMEWVLQIENPSVLCWFLTKGGVMILATWLSQAASEEQTSVLSVALKVLSHLPLHKALPVHMSEILQAINRLRFYRISDISNRARVLLSKWSKMFSKSQASRKPNGIKSAGAPEIDLRQRIGELIEDESWQSSVNNSDLVLVPLDGDIDDSRKMETPKLLTASSDDSNKKHVLGSSTTHNKERRKVLLVEQPGHRTAGKSQLVKAVPSASGASQARPITADEIQKAKMRAQYIQSNKMKCEGPKKSSLLTNDLLSASEAYLRPKLEAQKKARLLPPRNGKLLDSSSDQKPSINEESLLEKCRRVQIPWRAPPEVQVNAAWEIGIGQNSKEIESQRNRMHREKETIYRTLHDVPPNPKDPWDIEIDFDDTLTPDIPTEQLPDAEPDADADADADGVDAPLDTQVSGNHNLSIATPSIPTNSLQVENGMSVAEPDLELLAVLLKNPELVFALTSGQASGLSSEDTVKLLDMLKSNSGVGLLNGLVEKAEEEKRVVKVSLPSPTPTRHVEVSLPSPTPPSRFEVSLPSPTPSSNLRPSGWASEAAKNPFSRNNVTPLSGATATVTASERFQNTSTLQSQFPSSTSTIPPLHQPFSSPSSSSAKPENHPTFFPSAPTQTPPISHLPMNPSSLHSERLQSNVSLYPRSSPGLSQPQMRSQQHYQSVSEPYLPVPDDSNRAMLRATHGLAHSSYSINASQNVYDPIARPESRARVSSGVFPGPSWERNELYPGGRKGFESLSPQKSPASYPPEQQSHGYGHGHGHGHGHGWNYQDQRGYHGHHPDRVSRYQNSLGYRDRSWRGGGGDGSRRWHDDRRR